MSLEPNEFSYKMFTSPKTKITEEDLVKAIAVYKDFWDKKKLKQAIKKVGLTLKIRTALFNTKNPLVSRFSNTNDKADYCIVYSTDFDSKYMTPEEYQLISYTYLSSIYTAIPISRQTNRTKSQMEAYVSILKRYPKTTQSRILLKYLEELLPHLKRITNGF